MNPEVLKFLYDIYQSINAIESYLVGIETPAGYKNDSKTIDAVERRLAIIGEALNKADKLNAALSISDKTKIIGLRHILVHDYDMMDNNSIWLICKKHLPKLREEVKIILDQG
ncbi:MAG: hypothetical protein BGO69_19230 [Bacteroidetes bacterium 46-16]|nr:MAG: hypothetical protein BGO69_19230 [Bacteroidetes bacterium 46-16]